MVMVLGCTISFHICCNPKVSMNSYWCYNNLWKALWLIFEIFRKVCKSAKLSLWSFRIYYSIKWVLPIEPYILYILVHRGICDSHKKNTFEWSIVLLKFVFMKVWFKYELSFHHAWVNEKLMFLLLLIAMSWFTNSIFLIKEHEVFNCLLLAIKLLLLRLTLCKGIYKLKHK